VFPQPKPDFGVLRLVAGPVAMIESVQEYLRSAKFIWADKIALLISFLFSTLLLVFWLIAFLVVGSLGARHLWNSFGIPGVEAAILTVGSAWILMRVADFLAGAGNLLRKAHCRDAFRLTWTRLSWR
jgi:hypothetical protein